MTTRLRPWARIKLVLHLRHDPPKPPPLETQNLSKATSECHLACAPASSPIYSPLHPRIRSGTTPLHCLLPPSCEAAFSPSLHSSSLQRLKTRFHTAWGSLGWPRLSFIRLRIPISFYHAHLLSYHHGARRGAFGTGTFYTIPRNFLVPRD
jgi:hypothetical protein